MKDKAVFAIDVSMIYADFGGEKKREQNDPMSNVLHQAASIIDSCQHMFPLVVLKAEFTDTDEFLRVTEKLFTATYVRGGQYIASPNTNENQKILADVLNTNNSELSLVLEEFKTRAKNFYRENASEKNLLAGLRLIQSQ